jgi:GNAT superfamily N-acetyltransferase
MTFTLREATPADDPVLDEIARKGDASADADYLELLRSQGARLLVAEVRGEVIGFGGVVDASGVAMLSDLFITPAARGRGVGGALLRELLTAFERRMTFSSKHPGALPAYRRVGMEPRGRLLYIEGAAAAVDAPPLVSGPWGHDRSSMVAMLERQGARVHADVVLMPEAAGIWIARLQSIDPRATFRAAIAACPVGATVRCCVPEGSPVAADAQRLGFAIVDHDIFCATDGVRLADDLHCLDPGLA